MPMQARPRDFQLPEPLYRDVLSRLRVNTPDSVESVDKLLYALIRRMPRGNETKLLALAAGEIPPGADPVEVAETWLAHPHRSWGCWGSGTLFAALLKRSPFIAEVNVVASRRCLLSTAEIDIHAQVTYTAADGTEWVCDPHFGIGSMRATGDTSVRLGIRAEIIPADTGFRTLITVPYQKNVMIYKEMSKPLDPYDALMFSKISTVWSGVPLDITNYVWLLSRDILSLRVNPESGESRLLHLVFGKEHDPEPELSYFYRYDDPKRAFGVVERILDVAIP